MELEYKKLGEIADFINGGAWSQDEYAQAGIPVVRVTDCQDGTIDLTECKYLPMNSFGKYQKHKLHYQDLVIATVGSHPTQPGSVVGRATIVPKHAEGSLLNQNAVCIRPIDTSLDKMYLGYVGRSQVFRDYIISCARGSANQVRMSISLLKQLPLLVPNIEIQRKIAAILSAYDDLIENNNRRIKILEEMARLIYREWFVNFRFPGHEQVNMINSPLGKIPEEWNTQPIGEVVDTLGGGTPSTKVSDYWDDGDIQWFTPSDLTKAKSMFIHDSEKKISKLGFEKSSARKFPPFSVMMTSRATIGVTSINTSEACTNQGFITSIPNGRLSAFHIYFWISDNLDLIKSIASGATYKEINRTEFRSLIIVVPDLTTARKFSGITAPIGEEISTLLKKNRNLSETRDLLLPKLISGELDVSEMDIELPEAAA